MTDMTPRHPLIAASLALAACAAIAAATVAAHEPHPKDARPSAAVPAREPRRATMDELHRMGGVPRGWTFAVPPGDPARGREVFADLECYKCHQIKGESFPAADPDPKNAGPELTGMGRHHPPEYFAESILAPNHVIVEGPGFTGPDGLSVMPSYADSLTLAQWVDLVAYIASLTDGHGHDDHAGEIVREAQAGDYQVRLIFAQHGQGHGHGHGAGQGHGAGHGDGAGHQHGAGHSHGGMQGHGAHGDAATQGHGSTPGQGGEAHGQGGGHDHGGAHNHGKGPGHGAGQKPGASIKPAPGQAAGHGHLMVFVVDRAYGEVVPYLPVTATIHARGAAPRTVKLNPMTGDRGFHYGADVALPPATEKVTLAIGPTSMAVMGASARKFKTPVQVTFEWGDKGA